MGLVDGLVQRDLRRWGGGFTWQMPVSINPAFVVVPFAILFAFSISITASTFKKYL